MRSQAKTQYGEGSIFPIADGKWGARIFLGKKPDGSPNVKQFSGKTEAIVKKKLRDFKKTQDFSEKRVPSKDTVRTYFANWLQQYRYPKLKPSSYDRLESTVVNHIYPHVGGVKIDRVTRDQVQTLINQLYQKEKLSYSSVKKVYVALNSCYKHALIEGAVSSLADKKPVLYKIIILCFHAFANRGRGLFAKSLQTMTNIVP